MVWRATVEHYHMWGLNHEDSDEIITNFLPILQQYKFDFHINGHEHILAYANLPFDSSSPKQKPSSLLKGDDCDHDISVYHNDEVVQEVNYTKG